MRQLDLRLLGLLHQDRHPGFQFRRLDGHRQAPAEAGFQPLFQAFDFLRIAVAGEDHLLAAFEKGIEGVEELLLGALLTGEELDVVDQQCVHRAVEALEFVDGVELQGLHHVRDETFRMQVDHLGVRVLLQQVVAHRMHQVGLAQTDATVEEQRVVTVLEVVRHLPGGGAGQLVGLALDEVLEGEGTVEIAGVLQRTFDLDVALGAHRRRCSGRHGGGQRIDAGFFRLVGVARHAGSRRHWRQLFTWHYHGRGRYRLHWRRRRSNRRRGSHVGLRWDDGGARRTATLAAY